MAPRVRTKPRKKPVQERSRDTVDAILAATARILVKEGYDRTSTNRVALAAGVSIGSLYQYFPSKEALVAALIDRHRGAMMAIVERKLAEVAQAPLAVAVPALVSAMLDAHAVDPKLHKVLVEQIPRTGGLEAMQEIEKRATALVRAYLEARRTEVRKKDLDLAARICVATAEALTHGATLHEPAYLTDPRFRREVADILLRYLCD